MPEISDQDIIWIQDAEKEYKRNRKTLQSLIDEGKLSVVGIEGDRRAYLLRSELDAVFRPKIIKPAKDEQAQ